SKCCNGATELTAPRYTVIVQWLTYRLRIAPGLQVPFGASRKVSSRFSDQIDIERSLESNLTRFGPTTNQEEERRKEDWWYYLGQKTAKGPLIETGRQF
ncbi:hypothetical protein V1478_017888, partial [Vespula squamosa]